MRAVDVFVADENHTVVADGFAPVAHQVFILRIVDSGSQKTVVAGERHGVLLRRLQLGIALLHDVAVVVVHRAVELPERRALRFAAVVQAEAYASKASSHRSRRKQVVVLAVEVFLVIKCVGVVEVGVLVAESGAEGCAIVERHVVLDESGASAVVGF